MIFLETTVLVRYLTGDDPQKAARCERLLKAAATGRITLYVTHLMLAETIWVLHSFYQFPKDKIVDGLRRLLNTPHIHCDEAPLMLAALDLFESKSISFIDAYHAVALPSRDITELYSYDTDFDQLAGITRREP
ncbi:MAG: type II toxin-antitoxin system VapC family toxin [Candidatus Omnitrophica bacterium]|nr:type II toxin-antitoxin system VapC family toxin [Candidatus Omnitrophota bacterium]